MAPRRKRRSRPSPKKKIKRRELTKAEAADMLGITERRIEQLLSEHDDIPCMGRGKDRRFLWPQLREWRDKQLIQEGVRSVRPATLDEARQRKTAAEADLAEMERDERRGQLVPVAMYRQEFEGACSRVRAAGLNAPIRYSPQLLEKLSQWVPASALRLIEEFLTAMMTEIMAELEAGDDVPEDDDIA